MLRNRFEFYITNDCQRYQFVVDGKLAQAVRADQLTRGIFIKVDGEEIVFYREDFMKPRWEEPCYIMMDRDGGEHRIQIFKDYTVEAVSKIKAVLYDFE